MSDSLSRAVSIRIGVSTFAPALPRRAAERDAVEAREHDIEQQQIEPLLPDAIERLTAVSDAFGLEPCQAQMQPQDLAYRSIVLDDERVQAWRRSTHQPIFAQ